MPFSSRDIKDTYYQGDFSPFVVTLVSWLRRCFRFCTVTYSPHLPSHTVLLGRKSLCSPLFKELGVMLCHLEEGRIYLNYMKFFCVRDLSSLLFFFKDFIYLFLERGREGERGRETSMCGHLSCSPYWGPGLQPRHVCALTGNRTGVPLVCRLALNPLSDTSQGILLLFIYSIICINMDSWIFILKFELKI